MGYFKSGYNLVLDHIDGGERTTYGEGCIFAKETFHGLATAALGGAGVSIALGRPLLGVAIGIMSVPFEQGAQINKRIASDLQVEQA